VRKGGAIVAVSANVWGGGKIRRQLKGVALFLHYIPPRFGRLKTKKMHPVDYFSFVRERGRIHVNKEQVDISVQVGWGRRSGVFEIVRCSL
jgi:hypothetical protein